MTKPVSIDKRVVALESEINNLKNEITRLKDVSNIEAVKRSAEEAVEYAQKTVKIPWYSFIAFIIVTVVSIANVGFQCFSIMVHTDNAKKAAEQVALQIRTDQVFMYSIRSKFNIEREFITRRDYVTSRILAYEAIKILNDKIEQLENDFPGQFIESDGYLEINEMLDNFHMIHAVSVREISKHSNVRNGNHENFRAAVTNYETMQKDNKTPTYLSIRGLLEELQGRYSAAEESFREAIDSQIKIGTNKKGVPSKRLLLNADYINLSETQILSGKYTDAINSANHYISTHKEIYGDLSNDTDSHFLYAEMCQAVGEYLNIATNTNDGNVSDSEFSPDRKNKRCKRRPLC